MMGINKASEEYMATLADNNFPEQEGIYQGPIETERLLKDGIRKRDERITELEVAASAALNALDSNKPADAWAILRHALSPEKSE